LNCTVNDNISQIHSDVVVVVVTNVHYRDVSRLVLQGHGPDLQNILWQPYDNAKITIDLRRTSNLQNILQWMENFS